MASWPTPSLCENIEAPSGKPLHIVLRLVRKAVSQIWVYPSSLAQNAGSTCYVSMALHECQSTTGRYAIQLRISQDAIFSTKCCLVCHIFYLRYYQTCTSAFLLFWHRSGRSLFVKQSARSRSSCGFVYSAREPPNQHADCISAIAGSKWLNARSRDDCFLSVITSSPKSAPFAWSPHRR